MNNYLYKGVPTAFHLVNNDTARTDTPDHKIWRMVKTPTKGTLPQQKYNGDNTEYLTHGGNFKFIPSDELKDGYNVNTFVDRNQTPYLPIVNNYLNVRLGDYSYATMKQKYWSFSRYDTTATTVLTLSARVSDDDKIYLNINGTEQEVASPIIYLILQAGGGNGGIAYYQSGVWPFSEDTARSGGSGGSGAAALIGLNLKTVFLDNKNGQLDIQCGPTSTNAAVNGNNIYIKLDSNHFATLGGGKIGGDANASNAGGNGTKGEYTLRGTPAGMYFVGTNGTDGSAGASVTGNKTREGGTNTTRANKFQITAGYDVDIRPYKSDGTAIRHNTSNIGHAESRTSGDTILICGPGGAPSPLCPGKSHINWNLGDSDIEWPGAGGVGESGWNGCMNAEWPQDHNKGGPAAAWLFYLPAHSWNDWESTVEPTCTTAGYYSRTCSCCNEKITDIKTNKALGHNYIYSYTQSPGCSTQGYDLYTCSRCQNEKKENYSDAIGHNYVFSDQIEPTCTSQGYSVYQCVNCGNSYEDDYVPANGHELYGQTTPATQRDDEYTETWCYNCDYYNKTVYPGTATGYSISVSGGQIIAGSTRVYYNTSATVTIVGLLSSDYPLVKNVTGANDYSTSKTRYPMPNGNAVNALIVTISGVWGDVIINLW